MNPVYVCKQLETVKNIYGGYDCKEWIIYNPASQSVWQTLAITGEQAKTIGISILGCFAIMIAFAIIIKAAKLI